jgi:hypothetical protein
MNIEKALEIVRDIQTDMGEGLLETLQYMDRNLFQFDEEQRSAFRVTMREFSKLFAPKKEVQYE